MIQPYTAPPLNYKTWNVYLDGILIQTVDYIDGLDRHDVKLDLIYYSGLDPKITLRLKASGDERTCDVYLKNELIATLSELGGLSLTEVRAIMFENIRLVEHVCITKFRGDK